MPLPTFVIAGAQKCGTTSLADALRQHDQIHMSRPKELHFFDRHFEKGLEWYESKFRPGPHHAQVGEATPVYMYDDVARERLVETLPDARIVMILRNPVDRAYSHYWHARRLGREDLTSFEDALAAEPERRDSGATVRARARFAYVHRGHYLPQIEPLVAAYGRDQVRVMLLDDLAQDRVATMGRLLEFLDVDRSQAEALEVHRRNQYRTTTDAGTDVSAEYVPLSDRTRARLTEVYAESNDRLAAFLGRDLSDWQRA